MLALAMVVVLVVMCSQS